MPQEVSQAIQHSLKTWLTLHLIPGLGLLSCHKLLQHPSFCVQQFLSYDKVALSALGFKSDQINFIQTGAAKSCANVLQWLCSDQHHFVVQWSDADYPAALREIAGAPLLLFGRGNRALLNSEQMAMVGSRNPSQSGKMHARSLAAHLCECGWTVTSGLALGIDACAHQGALQAKGNTIGVLGCGPDVIYPKRNQALFEQILLNDGCIVSEFLPGVAAKADHFPRRNRIVSGLSRGVLVVEAAIKSGSLITARYAIEQNRDVFAVPGNINNPVVAGCHLLIKQGAKLVEGVDDINQEYLQLGFLQQPDSAKNLQKKVRENLASDRLLDSVDYEVTAVDMVAERSGLPVSEVLVQLLEYELRGLVAAVPGGYVKLGDK